MNECMVIVNFMKCVGVYPNVKWSAYLAVDKTVGGRPFNLGLPVNWQRPQPKREIHLIAVLQNSRSAMDADDNWRRRNHRHAAGMHVELEHSAYFSPNLKTVAVQHGLFLGDEQIPDSLFSLRKAELKSELQQPFGYLACANQQDDGFGSK